MFIESAVREFLVNCSIKSYSKRTIKSYRNNLTRFFSFVSEKEIEQIDSAKIKQQISELQNKGLKTSYINNLIKTLRAFCSYLIEQEYITVNPMKKVPWCKERIVLIKAFSDDEVKQMMSAYSEKDFMELRNKTIMALLLDTGIRCFELCSVCNESIKDNYITISGKGNKERIAAISPPLHKLMLKYVRTRDKYFTDKTVHCNNFFLSRTGRPLTNAAVERIVRIAGERAEINDSIRCSPHTCRHYFAQAQIRNGCDIYTLSKLLGHTNIKITQVYLNSMEDKDIINKALTTSPLSNL
ncbi:MAG: tyrosine-type recombinase/integrase [Oscillospiraceae bacterium]|nr:tyrosine-type recombinase/integrase [Oscillospiraceae bacterium]